MCGIAGLYRPRRHLSDAGRRVGAMLGAMHHRGPDASGVEEVDGGAIGAVRLAVIDLQGGDQPLYNEDRTVVAVFNGEIYNHPELFADLHRNGHKTASRADSEVLAHLYEDVGIDGLVRRLDGMFAFALWDGRLRRLHLVRDRYGVKPLHWAWDGETLAFASEVKALAAGGAIRPRLDLDAWAELLTFQNILSDRSLFEGVRLLPAASVLTVDEDGLRIDRYWDGLPCPDRRWAHGPDLDEAVRETFQAGVRRQLVADVEVAAYLSGGLDTGSIAATAAKALPRLTTFATGFDVTWVTGMESEFDERADARALAESFGTHHKELVLDAADLEMILPRLVRALEEPRMSFSYPNYLTAGLASRWVKVVLSGAGGDEVFGGYPWRYGAAEEDDWKTAYFGWWQRLLTPEAMAELLTDDARGRVDLHRPRRLFDDVLSDVDGAAPLEAMLYFEFRTYLQGLLVLEDKLSMAHSLEARVPFLDNALVDLMLTVPAEVKLFGERSKDLFRRAMAPVLSAQAVERKKTGFAPPQAAWFRGPQADYVASVLLSERAVARGLLRPDVVAVYVERHKAGESDHRLLLWTLLCMEWWHRIFEDGEHVT